MSISEQAAQLEQIIEKIEVLTKEIKRIRELKAQVRVLELDARQLKISMRIIKPRTKKVPVQVSLPVDVATTTPPADVPFMSQPGRGNLVDKL